MFSGGGPLTRSLSAHIAPTGIERQPPAGAVLVAKTDPVGRITYLSEDYRQLLGLTEKEVIGAPHSLVRHPLMPAAVFHRLWVRLRAGRDFAFPVVNMTAAGDHFWAMARISPMREGNGAASGYHASLRVLARDCIEEAGEIYGRMRAVEGRCEDEREGIAASLSVLERALRGRRTACAELQAI